MNIKKYINLFKEIVIYTLISIVISIIILHEFYADHLIDFFDLSQTNANRVFHIILLIATVISMVLMTFHLITYKIKDKELNKIKDKYESVVNNVKEVIFQADMNGKWTFLNPVWTELTGFSVEECLGKSLVDYISKDDLEIHLQEFINVIEGKKEYLRQEIRYRKKDGKHIWIEVFGKLTLDKNGKLLGISGTLNDINERKLIEQENRLKDKLLQGMSEISNVLLDNSNYIEALKSSVEKLVELTKVDRVYIWRNDSKAEDLNLVEFGCIGWDNSTSEIKTYNVEYKDNIYKNYSTLDWQDKLSKGKFISGSIQELSESEQVVLRSQGLSSILILPIMIDEVLAGAISFSSCKNEKKWHKVEIDTLLIAAALVGASLKRMLVEKDLQRALQSEVKYLAYYDSLTGLPNRVLLKDRLELAISHAKRNNNMLSVVFVDLDRFKIINDTLGHEFGDLLLKEVSKRLISALREDDTVARMGGDEFTIIVTDIDNENQLVDIVEKIIDVLKEPISIEDKELYVTSSIGISSFPVDGQDTETLLKNADIAMYRAKELGRNNFQFFTKSMNEKAIERLELEGYLRKALEKEELIMYYQPQVDINTRKVIGCEALIRWKHPIKGMISPAEFIPLAEETGLIIPIGQWVLKTVCVQLKKWNDAGYDSLKIAINISPKQFEDEDIVQTISKAIKQSRINPLCVEIEITENIIMKNTESTMEILKQLKNIGVRISIDDFGTGFSSLGYLQKFSADVLKVDQSFIRNLISSEGDAEIVTAIINMAHGLKLKVVAEGVETEEQMEFLKLRNCDEIQGYLFGRPVPAEEFEKNILEKL